MTNWCLALNIYGCQDLLKQSKLFYHMNIKTFKLDAAFPIIKARRKEGERERDRNDLQKICHIASFIVPLTSRDDSTHIFNFCPTKERNLVDDLNCQTCIHSEFLGTFFHFDFSIDPLNSRDGSIQMFNVLLSKVRNLNDRLKCQTKHFVEDRECELKTLLLNWWQ